MACFISGRSLGLFSMDAWSDTWILISFYIVNKWMLPEHSHFANCIEACEWHRTCAPGQSSADVTHCLLICAVSSTASFRLGDAPPPRVCASHQLSLLHFVNLLSSCTSLHSIVRVFSILSVYGIPVSSRDSI